MAGQSNFEPEKITFPLCSVMSCKWGSEEEREKETMLFYLIGFFIWFNVTLRNINLLLHLILSVPLAKRNALIYKLKQALR